MAPIKFEEKIKEKIEDRRLKPSSDAWDKLSERLDSRSKKRQIKPVWWFGLAASIVGVLFVITQVLNNNSVDNTPILVDSPNVIEDNQQIAIEETAVEVEKVLEEENQVQRPEKESSKNEQPIIQKQLIPVKTEIAIAKEDIDVNNKIIEKSQNVISKQLSFEEQKIQDVVAQVQALKETNKNVTDEAIENLLLEAQKEIRLQQLYNENTGMVDASLLLQDVEADLEQSFRDKVFEAIKASYGTVKTAVAQRND